MKHQKILLAFSGGLDTSAIVPWLKDTYGADVICYCSDLGNAPDAKFLEAHAKKLGASELIFEDLQNQFVSEFVNPLLRSGALYQDDYLLGTAIARPIIAERVAYWAKQRGATAIAHGATGKGNDQIRFERSWAFLVPEIEIIAPWKIWSYTGRQDLLSYLAQKGHPFEAEEKRYSVDVNLLHRSCEGGILEDISKAFNPKDIYAWTKPIDEVTPEKTQLTLSFVGGVLQKINNETSAPEAMLKRLNEIGGKHGVGVVDLVESRANGIKSRGIYETPGGTIIYKALNALKHACWDRSLMSLSKQISLNYAEKVYDGQWHSQARFAMDAFFTEAAKTLTGDITLQLQQAQITIQSRQSPYSLYDENLVSFEKDPHKLHTAADGYCRTLRLGSWQEGKQQQKLQQKL